MSLQILLQICYQLQLLVNSQTADNHLQQGPDSDVELTDQTAVVHISEHTHQESIKIHVTMRSTFNNG